MAGDWMKVELELPDKPEVHFIASALTLDPAAVVGHLIKVWAWFNKHTQDGHAQGVTHALLDRITGVTGMGETMMSAGWLEQHDNMLCMPKFDRHTSESAKKRALASNRQSRKRHAESVTKALPEKRREEIKELGPTLRKKPASACPETFEVNDVMAQWAVSQGLPEGRVIPETEKFLDHWRAVGKVRTDWDATWRNWIRKAVEFRAK
jgi:hypothetical protein